MLQKLLCKNLKIKKKKKSFYDDGETVSIITSPLLGKRDSFIDSMTGISSKLGRRCSIRNNSTEIKILESKNKELNEKDLKFHDLKEILNDILKILRDWFNLDEV